MNENELDRWFDNAAEGGQYAMDQAHLDAALGMIKKERTRRYFFWWWTGAAVVMALALWMWSPWIEASSETQVIQPSNQAALPIAQVEEETPTIEAHPEEEKMEKMETIVRNSVFEAKNAPQSRIEETQNLLGSALSEKEVEVIPVVVQETTTPAASQRETIETAMLASLSGSQLPKEPSSLSSGDISVIRSPLPLRWNAILEVNNYNINTTAVGAHGGRIGLSLIKPLSARSYLAFEPMIAWTTDFASDHLITETSDYGLEVSSRAFRIQPDLVVSGQLNVQYGLALGRWKMQTGPSIFFVPWARGDIHELDVDQGQWTDIARIGSGNLSTDLSEPWTWGWSGSFLYHLTHQWHIGLSMNYQHQMFFQKNHINNNSEDRLNIGLRTQYLFRS